MKCPCCNKYDVSDKKLKLKKALTSITGVCVVCFELVTQSAFDNLEDYVKVAGEMKFDTFEDTPFNYTNEEVIKAVKNILQSAGRIVMVMKTMVTMSTCLKWLT